MILERDQVLVVEDENEIRELITIHLQRDGYLVDACPTGEEAVQLLNQKQYNMVVLDWMLPGVSGLEIARIIRKKSHMSQLPILMVTARTEPTDIIAGLEAGADDYIPKPFDTSILMARVRALIRRSKWSQQSSAAKTKIKIESLEIDLGAHKVFCNSEEIHLTPSEFKLLQTLATANGKVYSREALIKEVQGSGVSVVDRAIDTHVFGLRKKLGPCSDVLETVRGVGYRVKSAE